MTDGTERFASEEELAEFAANISGRLDLDAVADDMGHAVINASPSCLRDNKQRLEAEGFNTELYIDSAVYDDPTLLVHPRPGDLDGDSDV